MQTIKILLTEDPLINVTVALALKTQLPFNVTLQLAKCDTTAIHTCSEFQPDIIIVTHAGPTLGCGLDVARHLKTHHLTRHIPVILLSSLSGDQDVQYAIRFGIHTYLTYPIDKQQLIQAVTQIANHEPPTPQHAPHLLYQQLADTQYNHYPYQRRSLGEDMQLIEQVICGYWKPRYIIDQRAHTATQFMDEAEILTTVRHGDILWHTLQGMTGIGRAHRLSAHYPTRIDSYRGDIAIVSWQINPDGMYFMDSDGYGITDDQEETLYACIDRQGRILAPFRSITHISQLADIRREATQNEGVSKRR